MLRNLDFVIWPQATNQTQSLRSAICSPGKSTLMIEQGCWNFNKSSNNTRHSFAPSQPPPNSCKNCPLRLTAYPDIGPCVYTARYLVRRPFIDRLCAATLVNLPGCCSTPSRAKSPQLLSFAILECAKHLGTAYIPKCARHPESRLCSPHPRA